MTRAGRPWGAGVGLLLLLAGWTAVGALDLGTHGAVLTPWAVVRQVARDGPHLYLDNALVTLTGAGQGFALGAGGALAVACLVLLVPALESAASQLAVISYCTPLTAVGPIVLVVVGGRAPTVFLAAISVFFTTLVGALLGLRSADPTGLELIRAYGGGRGQELLRVRLIAALPAVINALKIAAPGAMLGAILGEYLGGIDTGLGVALTLSQQQFEVARTWALALLVGLLAGIGYAGFALVGRLLTPWARA